MYVQNTTIEEASVHPYMVHGWLLPLHAVLMPIAAVQDKRNVHFITALVKQY